MIARAKQLPALFDVESAEKVFHEMLTMPKLRKIDFRYKADVDEIPIVKCTIERFVLPEVENTESVES